MTQLQETLDLLVTEVLGKFDLNLFKKLSAGNVRPTSVEDQVAFAYTGKSHPEIEYALKFLPELSKDAKGGQEGSSRRVFALSGGKALKISMNPRGNAQNQAEVQISQANADNTVTTKVYDSSPDGKWVIAELVKPLSREEFERMLKFPTLVFVPIRDMLWKGGPDLVKRWVLSLKRMVTDGEMLTQDSVGNTVKTRDLMAAALQVTKNPEAMSFIQNVIAFAKKNNFHKGEIVPQHFGRTADGRIIFYDYGGTEEVINAYY